MDSGCGSGRHYVDPWDVASYEFLLGAPSTDSSDFYFVSPHHHQLSRRDGEAVVGGAWSPCPSGSGSGSSRSPELAASLEEAHFCNGHLSWHRVRAAHPHAATPPLSRPNSASASESGSPLTDGECDECCSVCSVCCAGAAPLPLPASPAVTPPPPPPAASPDCLLASRCLGAPLPSRPYGASKMALPKPCCHRGLAYRLRVGDQWTLRGQFSVSGQGVLRVDYSHNWSLLGRYMAE